MGRASTKTDLINSAQENYSKLKSLILQITEAELKTPFDFSGDVKKKEAHWNRDKNLRDVLIHLYEWHKLILNWVESNTSGKEVPFLPPPYNWKTYGDMNLEFWQKHQNTELDQAKKLLEESHAAVMALVEKFSNEQLFSKDVYNWVGGSTLGAYFVSASASHYDWAIKKLKAHKKTVQNKTSSCSSLV